MASEGSKIALKVLEGIGGLLESYEGPFWTPLALLRYQKNYMVSGSLYLTSFFDVSYSVDFQ